MIIYIGDDLIKKEEVINLHSICEIKQLDKTKKYEIIIAKAISNDGIIKGMDIWIEELLMVLSVNSITFLIHVSEKLIDLIEKTYGIRVIHENI